MDINNRIVACEYDIKEVQFIVDEIEKIITENNLRIEKMKVSKVNDNAYTQFTTNTKEQRIDN
jgi:chemotaxis signal transduction protein